MKIASAATKRTELNLLSAAAAMSRVFETNNKLRLRLRLQNEQ